MFTEFYRCLFLVIPFVKQSLHGFVLNLLKILYNRLLSTHLSSENCILLVSFLGIHAVLCISASSLIVEDQHHRHHHHTP